MVSHRLPKRTISQPKISPMTKMSPIDSHGSVTCSIDHISAVSSVVPKGPIRVLDSAENIAAWKVLEQFAKPVVTAFSDNDPVSKGGDIPIQARIPGAKGQPHVTLSGGHFLQEDCPNDIVEILDALIARS